MKQNEYNEWKQVDQFRQACKLWICAMNYSVVKEYAERYYRDRINLAYQFQAPNLQQLIREQQELEQAFTCLVQFYERIGLSDLL